MPCAHSGNGNGGIYVGGEAAEGMSNVQVMSGAASEGMSNVQVERGPLWSLCQRDVRRCFRVCRRIAHTGREVLCSRLCALLPISSTPRNSRERGRVGL